MKLHYLIMSSLCAAALAGSAVLVPASAKTMKECAAEWKEKKAANQTATPSTQSQAK